MFDTISSMPGVIFPFKQLTELCKRYDVLSLIDGAHGVGCIPQDLSEIDPDFYVSNLHKWYFVPFGCAVLYVATKHHNNIHTFPISHSYVSDETVLEEEDQLNHLVDRFFFNGTKNVASIAVIPDAIRFRENECGGEQAIFDYCHGLTKQVATTISSKWGTSYLEQEDGPTLISTMVTIEVPTKDIGLDVDSLKKNWNRFIEVVYTKMSDEYKAYTPCVIHNDKLYARYSCQIYNELNDYEVAADYLIKALKEFVELELQFKNLKI
ncbi:uncharacterized protein J8A68_004543 [[Candida] subhashii]|uniref:Aminotransferase class V domain-containing protein n=1 Tax=[Candida] subhashii TaxID=561895 RepID=A0A8J5UUW3_9ASCO|nr:uncharacterized protein J8A68_004543 [[Candida] subhashii]KAG7661940.1 hypothetical protein J8A68_004543 [[Candida] subhashii]